MRLYSDLASWWPLFSPASEYEGEAESILELLAEALGRMPASALELGSGGGHLASFLRRRFPMTLVDVAPGMLEVSKKLNPGCEHVQGDLRSVRLGAKFDAVIVHDAIMYMTSRDDLDAALATVRAHLADGGVAVVLPDCVAETFVAATESGGAEQAPGDAPGERSVRVEPRAHEEIEPEEREVDRRAEGRGAAEREAQLLGLGALALGGVGLGREGHRTMIAQVASDFGASGDAIDLSRASRYSR